jgi:Micrococcal nuclease (thermonuclease) homologs
MAQGQARRERDMVSKTSVMPKFGVKPRLILALGGIGGVVLAAFLSAAAEVRVTDGDGLVLNGERIRLWGIDAPELEQTCWSAGASYSCGEQARETLAELVAGHEVRCETVSRDRYGRTVARCEASGFDLGREMVRRGWALDFRRYSDGRYAADQAEARAEKKGLWAGEFEPPWEWRR